MKLILDVKNLGRRYEFSLYTVHTYEDGAVSENSRVVESDNEEEFFKKLREYIKSPS